MFSLFWPVKLIVALFKLCLSSIVLGTCILTLMALMGDRGWIWSLSTHFRVQYLIVQLIAFALASHAFWKQRNEKDRRQPKMEIWFNLVFLGFFAGLNLVCILPYYNPQARPAPELIEHAGHVKLMHFNLFGHVNHRGESVIEAIRNEDPDMLDLVEYNETWKQKITASGLLKRFPYHVDQGYNVALFSKLPLKNTRLVFADTHQRVANQANIIANFTLRKQPVTILVAHPASPIRPSHLVWLQESFKAWEAQREKLGKNLILVGDLNTSPWSVEFQQLIQKTGLRDSQLGYGIQPSWPMLLPWFGIRHEPNWFTGLLTIPIDHVLVSDRMVVISRHTGPFVGSDHLPVTVELGIQPLSNR